MNETDSTPDELRPVVLVDTREQTPLPVHRFLEVKPAGLYSGDYSIEGFEDAFAVERKSLADLTGSLTSGRDRFERELLRLRSMRFARLLIVADPAEVDGHRYRSRIKPASVWGSLAAFEARFDVPVVWESDETRAARLVARWAHYFHREEIRRFASVRVGCDIEPATGTATLQLPA